MTPRNSHPRDDRDSHPSPLRNSTLPGGSRPPDQPPRERIAWANNTPPDFPPATVRRTRMERS